MRRTAMTFEGRYEMSSPEVEFRCTTTRPVEVRNASQRKVGGYGAVFNSPSKDFGGWKEIVDPAFFNKDRGDTGFRNAVCKYEHRDLLGTVRGKTLELRTDATGLFYEVQVPKSRDDVFELVARGDLSGSSFAFIAREDEWRHERGMAVRHLISGHLQDVSIVANPAYDAATASLRSFAAQFDADYDEVLRDFQSGQQARYFVRTDNRLPTPAVVAEPAWTPSPDLVDKQIELEMRRRQMEVEDREIRMARMERAVATGTTLFFPRVAASIIMIFPVIGTATRWTGTQPTNEPPYPPRFRRSAGELGGN